VHEQRGEGAEPGAGQAHQAGIPPGAGDHQAPSPRHRQPNPPPPIDGQQHEISNKRILSLGPIESQKHARYRVFYLGKPEGETTYLSRFFCLSILLIKEIIKLLLLGTGSPTLPRLNGQQHEISDYTESKSLGSIEKQEQAISRLVPRKIDG
jgi:hypothetical protein